MGEQKIALVTGGTRGIGSGIAIRLAEKGIHSILVGRDEKGLQQNVLHIKDKGGEASYLTADFDQVDAVQNLILDLDKRNLNPNILIHGLGGGFQSRTFDDISVYERIMNLNFHVAVNLSNLFINRMLKQKWGRIIFIGTLAINQLSAEGPYVCSKSALMTYMKLFSKRVAESDENVIVSAISPGAISVPGKYLHKIESENPKALKEFLESNKIAAGRLGKISEVANVAEFLCSDQATYLHGVNIQIDGGASN